MNQVKWKPRKSSYVEAMDYIKGRRKGEITSLKTRWEKFNYAALDGLEWNSLVTIGARSGGLKTTLKDQIIRDSFTYNPDMKFKVLDLSMEMVSRVTALRELSAATGKSYKYLCSADGLIEADDYVKCQKYGEDKGNYEKYPVDVIEIAPTIAEFGEIIDDYMEVNSSVEEEKKVYTPALICIDHSLLFADIDADINKKMHSLAKLLIAKKKAYPIIFILLSQLNRAVDQEGRNDEKKYGNYIVSSDFYGSDALLFASDILIGMDRPATRNIRIYGTAGFIIDSEEDLVIRWIKCRNGEGQLSFFKVDFKSMTIHESEPPPTVKGGAAEREKTVFKTENKHGQTKANL